MFDLMVEGCDVVDGTGTPAYRATVGITGARIAWIGRGRAHGSPASRRVVRAEGRVLTPGFIDAHDHSDLAPLIDPWMPSMLRQGVTTVIVGNCGASAWPAAGAAECASMAGGDPDAIDLRFRSFGDLLERLESAKPAVNVAGLVGHGAIRAEVLGAGRGVPDDRQTASMRRLVASALEDGAFGLSTGLIYEPGIHASTQEIVSLARELAPTSAVYASHIRGEGAHLFKAVAEAVAVGRDAEVPVHISHLKCESAAAWGRATDLLARVHAGGATADQYPYTAWASSLASLLPPWVPLERLGELLEDREARTRLIRAVEEGEGDTFQSSVDGVGWDAIVIESSGDGASNGMSVADVGRTRGMDPADACLALLIEDPATACVGHAMHEDDVRTILADPQVMVASDGISMDPAGPLRDVPVHPRNYGTFPRALGRYVREGTLTLEDAVRKMTALPADRFGLAGRGRVAEDAVADLVLLDPSSIRDTATFGAPHAFPEGIDLVIVNGHVAWNGSYGERAGMVLRRGRA